MDSFLLFFSVFSYCSLCLSPYLSPCLLPFLNFLFRFLCIFFPYSFIRSQLPKKPWQSIFPIV